MWIVACLLALAAATPNAAPASPPASGASETFNEEALRRYAWARLLEERGDLDQALAEYYRILVLEPRSAPVLIRAAELAARGGDALRSLELADRALAVEPVSARGLWLRGSARFNLGSPDDGLADLERALSLDSTRVEYARSLARAAEERNRIDLVARAYRAVVDREWTDREAWFQLAAAEARLGRFKEARSALTEASGDEGERPGASFLEGWIAEGLGDRDAAIEAYRKHLAAHRSDPTTRGRLVRLLADAGRPAEALAEAKRRSAEDPGNVEALEDVAELGLRAGRQGEVRAALERIEKLAPDDPATLARRVDLFARNRRHADAEAAAREWMKRHPRSPAGPYHLARALAMADQVEPAIEASRRAILAAPDSLAPRILLARIYQKHHRWEDAISAWQEALGRVPGQVGMTLDFAFCLQSLGDTLKAEREVRSLLESHPDHPQALNFLGYLLAEANRNLQEAEDMIRRALRRDPDNGAFVDSMGWVLYRLGRLEEARRELERATRLTDGDAVVREHLGDVYRDLRLHDLARDQYRRALDARGDGARLRSKLEDLPR